MSAEGPKLKRFQYAHMYDYFYAYRVLEQLIYCVKDITAVTGGTVWVGNLKHRNIDGTEVIACSLLIRIIAFAGCTTG
tara:strand:- start:359 stop:592 length:234 start_codon:yes stop_codon:yes gene_type:complete